MSTHKSPCSPVRVRGPVQDQIVLERLAILRYRPGRRQHMAQWPLQSHAHGLVVRACSTAPHCCRQRRTHLALQARPLRPPTHPRDQHLSR